MTQSQRIIAGIFALAAVIGFTLWFYLAQPEPVPEEPVVETPIVEEVPLFTDAVIGESVEGREITVTQFGTGDTHLLFVGGMHGGYEWNSSLLAYEYIDHLKANPSEVPEDLTISIIPVLNPDGLVEAVATSGPFTLAEVNDPTTRLAAGRFNANNVDLNRNFDCKWAPESSWRGETVSAGSGPFSEPEAAALRDFVLETSPDAVVFWHSQANNVYASECEDGVLPETLILMETYAEAADYGKVPVFDAYPITGDAEGWLASLGIPAITVELEGYQTTEWRRNLAGIEATVNSYSIAK